MKAYVHTPEGDYEVEANFLRPESKGDVVTVYGRDQDSYTDERPLATVKLSAQTFILYGDEHPQKRKGEGPLVA